MRLVLPVLLLVALILSVDGATTAYALRDASDGSGGAFTAWVAAGAVSLALLAAHLTLTIVRDARYGGGQHAPR